MYVQLQNANMYSVAGTRKKDKSIVALLYN